MPLRDMSPNIQEPEATGRKRSHDEFAEDIKTEAAEDSKSVLSTVRPTGDSLLPIVNSGSQPSPQGSPELTEAASSTPAGRSPSPMTPIKQEPAQTQTPTDSLKATASINAAILSSSSAGASQKRKRLTPAEKEARDKDMAEKKKEREEKVAQKAAEKAKQEEEKAAKAKEREEKAAQKAAEKKKQDEEKAAKAKEREEEKAAKAKEKEDKRKKKEEEQRRIQEENDKKERSQMKLGNFFIPSTPKRKGGESVASPEASQKDKLNATPKESTRSEYEKRFRPFFVGKNVHWERNDLKMDEQTREAKSRILDEYMTGQRTHELDKPFDPVQLFQMPFKPPKRGMLHHPVKHIMEQVYKETEKLGNAGTDEANRIIKEAREKLSKVPLKVISFSQDVRPPYYGTVTFKPFALGQGNMSKLARRTMLRRLPLDYDYDSEAEWQEEEGEDLDMDDEEEELDDEDDMEGFLDDSEDTGPSRRIFANIMEPESTGVCFEDESRTVANPILHEHKMEFMHEGLEQTWGIDPFSTQYWEPEPKAKTAKAAESSTKMAPPPTPANAFAALSSGSAASEAPKLVKSELMNEVKKAILDNSALSKVGIVDFIFQRFRDSVSRAEVKNTLEYVAEKKGSGRQKAWELKPGHEIVS